MGSEDVCDRPVPLLMTAFGPFYGTVHIPEYSFICSASWPRHLPPLRLTCRWPSFKMALLSLVHFCTEVSSKKSLDPCFSQAS